ncbi:MAG: tetratricopeptide repeat protein [Candidatus Latescibacteria bacterium]|nr:tetratricopeptide repeat protein [Candidatus Latescibacterota bacterium]
MKVISPIHALRSDDYVGALERKIAAVPTSTEAGRQAILRSLVDSLPDTQNLALCCDKILLIQCRKLLKKTREEAVSRAVGLIKRQCLNIRRAERFLDQVRCPAIDLEKIDARISDLETGQLSIINFADTPHNERYRLQVEKDRQGKVAWEGILTFVQHLFAFGQTAGPESRSFVNLVEALIWDERRYLQGEYWTWGLFTRGDHGVTERISLNLFLGGTGQTALLASPIQGSEDGDRFRLSILNAKESAKKYINDLTSDALTIGSEFDSMLRIGHNTEPQELRGGSAGLPIAVMMVAQLIHAPPIATTALTGEIDTSGNVLPVNGIREKVEAATQFGIEKVLLPTENFESLGVHTTDFPYLVPVRTLREACDHLFRDFLLENGYRAFPLSATSETREPERFYPSDVPVSSLVGRDNEMVWLHQGINRALSAKGSIILVSGEAGVGKSYLAEAAVAHARSLGMTVLRSACTSYSAVVPYLPIVDPLLRIDPPTSNPGSTEIWLNLVASLRDLLECLDDSRRDQSSMRQIRFFDIIISMFQHLMSGPGMVFLVDDLQWCDSGSLQLLQRLARHLEDKRLCILCTYRSERATAHWEESSHHLIDRFVAELPSNVVKTLRVNNLNTEQTRVMVESLLESHNIPLWLSDIIFSESEGNPLFVQEVISWWRASGIIPRNGYSLHDIDRTQISIPPKIYDLLRVRISNLKDEDREILEVAAVMGEVFDIEDVTEIIGYPSTTILRATQRLIRDHRLLNENEGNRYSFRHGKIREVTYQETTPNLRKAYHAAWCDLHLTGATRGITPSQEEIANHCMRAGREVQSLPYLQNAARRATEMCAYREATTYWERLETIYNKLTAVEADAEIELNLRLGQICYETGDYSTSAIRCKRAFRLAKLRCRPKHQGDALMRLGSIYRDRSRWETAKRLYNASLTQYHRSKDHIGTMAAKTNIGLLAYLKGDWASANTILSDALELAEECQNDKGIAICSGNLGNVAYAEGRNEEAIEFYHTSLKFNHKIRSPLGIAEIETNMGLIFERFLDWQTAADCHKRSIESLERLGSVRNLLNSYINYARVLLRLDDVTLAQSICSEMEGQLEDLGNQRLIAENKRVQALAAIRMEDFRQCQLLLRTSADICERIEDKPGYADTKEIIGEMFQLEGDIEKARAAYEDSIKLYEKCGSIGNIPSLQGRLSNLNSND